MKKIVALTLCLVMVLGLMAGCQKGMDVETLVQKMDEAVKNVTAQSMDMEMDLQMKIGASGVTMTMGLGMDGSVQARMDLSAMHMDADMKIEMLGQSEEMDMELYANLVDGALESYIYEGDSETWIKSVDEGYAEAVSQLQEQAGTQTMSQMPTDLMTLAEEQQTINDRSCYVLTLQLGGETFQSYMDTYMKTALEQAKEELETSGEELDEETAQMLELMEDLDYSALNGSVVYYVDAETFRPVQMDMEMLGLGEVLMGMITMLMEEMAMVEVDPAEMDMSFDIPVCKMSMKNLAYNEAVEVPAVPQEAIDNAIDANAMIEEPIVDEELLSNPPQEDGSYLLTLEGTNVRVMVPEGYVVYASDAVSVSGMTEDMMNSVNYMLLSGITAEDLKASVMEEVTWAQENDYYKSHTDAAELNGFETLSLIYNDDTSLWYAWKDLGGTILVLGAEVTGETFDLEALTATVEIAE